jgi:hypothetical protein
MNYFRIYNELTAEKSYRKKGEGLYLESHHIIPKCLGGCNSKGNLVLLTGREHFIAHKLLVKMHPGNRKLVHAWWRMTFTSKTNYQRGETLSARNYADVKEAYSKMKSVYGKTLLGDKNPNFGNRWTWEEKGYDKAKMKNRKRPNLLTPEAIRKAREAKLGAGNPNAESWSFRNKLTNEVIEFVGGMKRWCSAQGTSIKKIRSGTHPLWETI